MMYNCVVEKQGGKRVRYCKSCVDNNNIKKIFSREYSNGSPDWCPKIETEKIGE